MNTNGWSFALATFRSDGTPLGQAVIDVDWEPARQWTRHVALCEGSATGGDDGACVHPLWHHKGEPLVRGVRVRLQPPAAQEAGECAGGGSRSVAEHDFTNGYFKPYAQALSPTYVQAGLLAAGETFSYLPVAVRGSEPAAQSRLRLVVEDVSPALRAQAKPIGMAITGAVAVGEPLAGEIPALVPEAILDEVVAGARAAGSVEAGGVLVGGLSRDPDVRQVFVEVSAQIPALHTEATVDRLRFTAETWQHVRHEIDRRGQGETMVGWWHSHPVHAWCTGGDCMHDAPAVCAASQDCFSDHDHLVHRAAFSAAHCIAIVANTRAEGDVKLSVFGWHEGLIVRRGMHGVPPAP